MAIPNKPAGPYTLDSNNPLTAGATVYMMDVADSEWATRPPALGMTREQGYYRAHGNVTVKTDDPHGIGLRDVGGSPDNYITISDNGSLDFIDPDAYNVPFTKLFVFRPDTATATLFHSSGRDSADLTYSTGAQLVRVNGGNLQFLKSNEVFIGGSEGAPVVAGEVAVGALSYDGTTLRLSVNGLDCGTITSAQSGWKIDKVWLGAGALADSEDGLTLFMMAHWNDAKSMTALQSLTTNPYQLVGAAAAGGGGETPPADAIAPTVQSHTTSTDGASLTFTFTEPVEGFSAFTPSMFAFSNGHGVSSMTFGGATATVYIDPPLTPGENVSLNYTAPDPSTGYGIFDAAGNHVLSFSIPTVVNNAVAPDPNGKPSLPGYVLMTLGEQAWTDFKTESDLEVWVNSTDCRNLASPVMIWNYLDRALNFSGKQIGPIGSDRNKYMTFKPAPGRAYWELEPENADGSWGTLGDVIEVTNTTSWLTGMRFEGWKIHIPATAINETWRLRRNGWDQSGSESGMKYCKFWNESALPTFVTGEYGNYTMLEDVIILETNPGMVAKIQTGGGGEAYRCTFHRANVNNTTQALEGFNEVHACVFSNYGATPYVGNGNFSFNYSNMPTTSVGCTHVSLPMFESGVRPAAGTTIINGGGPKAVSKLDANGNNRGLNPDAGAIQRTPAMPLATGTLTRYEVDGSSLLVTVATQNQVDTATISISPADATSGAVSKGPFQMTLGAGTAAYEVDDIEPGNYLCTVLLSNAGGTNPVSGTSAFSINGVGGGTEDPGTNPPASAVTLQNAVTAATVGVASAPMRVGLNGAYSGVVTVGLDDGDSGTFTPGSPQIVNGDAMTFTYTPRTAGVKTITFSNDRGLVNPAPIQVNVAAAQLPTPSVTISTPQQNIMMGSRATLGGSLDFKGDATGVIEIFTDPVPSGTPVKFDGVVSVNGGLWTVQVPNLPVGEFRLRARVTANGQTSVASTGVLRIVPLVGIVNVPVA